MRSAMTISLPKQLMYVVKDAVKSGKYASTSEFFRQLLREWEEKRLLAELRQSQREIARGEGKILRSLKDLR